MDFARIPHRNLIASGLVALTIIVVGVLVNGEDLVLPKNDDTNSKKVLATGKVAGGDITERDSDGDGLFDWEERLHGSDPFSADTDGDGTFDGKELSLGRDPMKAGPNDTLPLLTSLDFATSSTDLDGIKKEYFAKYLVAAGNDVRETTFRDLIRGFDAKKFKPTNELLDLNVSSDVSPEALRAYGNAFGTLIQKYTATKLRTEEEIFEVAMATKSDSSLRDLQLLIIVYTNFSKDLRALLVPLPLAEHHLAIVNGYDGMAKGLTGMMHLYSNPIEGAAGYQTYTRLRLDVTIGYAGVVSYFIQEKVTFDKAEPGYPFYFNTTTRVSKGGENLSELE